MIATEICRTKTGACILSASAASYDASYRCIIYNLCSFASYNIVHSQDCMKQIIHNSEFASNIYSSLTNPTVCRNWNFCNENNAVKESSKCCLPFIATLFFSVLFSCVLVASTTDDSISISSCLGMKCSGFFEFVTTLTE